MEERGIDEKDVDLYYIKKKRIKIKKTDEISNDRITGSIYKNKN
jgi:hypothetical protein